MRNAPISPTGRRLLSRTAEHALRAALYLGRQEKAGLVSAAEVARALGMPPNYTAKTLRQLTRKGLLRSVRGPHGGFALRASRSELSIAHIVDAVDEPAEERADCLLGDRPCDAAHPCGAHRRWLEVQAHTIELLERTTLADLLNGDCASHAPALVTTTLENQLEIS
ncbi:MAG TPA: Rrf2 family transcriptional regulator [Longimicrobiales bacterium]|nr:Rrf2 family transcriptional regulator [Longimicrobiales bacterium]